MLSLVAPKVSSGWNPKNYVYGTREHRELEALQFLNCLLFFKLTTSNPTTTVKSWCALSSHFLWSWLGKLFVERWCTVLAISNCVRHDGTSYAVLKCVEAESWCGTSRCDTGTQCWVHGVNVEAAHFGARVLKRETTRGGPCQTGLEFGFFRG